MKQNRITGTTGLIENQDLIPKIILNLARKRRQVVYGARSIQAQNRLFARDTQDYDIFDRNPKKSAKIVQKQLDKAVSFDYFFAKQAEHKGTWKVKGKGNDLKANTKDDVSIVDYTDMPSRVPYIIKNGVRYRILREEIKAKQKAVADKEFKFRHEKDKNDLNRIKGYMKVNRIMK